ncbi:MAG: ATP synthase subunit I [Thermodesulfobacteriota bacterium]
MLPQTAKTTGADTGLAGATLVWRIGVANLAAGIIGTGALGFLKSGFAPGFALGFIVAVINVFWLMRVIRRGMSLASSAKAARTVARSYFVRFAATAVVLTLIVSKGISSPLPLLVGLTVSIFTTLGIMIFSALEEVSQDA